MKILLTIAETESISKYLQQPVETLYTATILQQRGHTVHILDLRTSDLVDRLWQETAPDLIFLLTQAYDRSQCFSLKLDRAQSATRTLRRLFPRTPIVVVGVHGTIEPEFTGQVLSPDCILPGEIEASIPWFVEQFTANPSIVDQLPSWGEIPQQVDPAMLPIPDYSLINVNSYRSEVICVDRSNVRFAKTGLIFANRGCPYSCAYCFVWFGKKLRYRSVDMVVEELRQQVRRDVHDFFFLDYTFTINRNWTLQLCAAIMRAGLDISWICQTRCERVDPELLTAMRQSGCSGIFFGIESPWIDQTDMLKPMPRSVIERAIAMTKQADILPFLFILVGIENQDPDAAQQLIDWLSCVPATFSANILLPRPHTALWNKHKPGGIMHSWQHVQMTSQAIFEQQYHHPGTQRFLAQLHELPNNIDHVQIERGHNDAA